MNIIEKAKNYVANLAPHIKKREAALLIVDLIRALEKQQEVIEKQPSPNDAWCVGCSPDNCSGCGE